MRYAKCIQINSVNSVPVSLTVSIEEYLLKALGLFGESAGGSHIPAVTHGTLPHVKRSDSIVAPKWISWEFIGGAAP